MPINLGKCRCIRETDAAVLVKPCKGNDCFEGELWIPKSVLDEDSECEEFETGEVFVRTWWAQKEGLD